MSFCAVPLIATACAPWMMILSVLFQLVKVLPEKSPPRPLLKITVSLPPPVTVKVLTVDVSSPETADEPLWNSIVAEPAKLIPPWEKSTEPAFSSRIVSPAPTVAASPACQQPAAITYTLWAPAAT
jgi:hypothetical protein